MTQVAKKRHVCVLFQSEHQNHVHLSTQERFSLLGKTAFDCWLSSYLIFLLIPSYFPGSSNFTVADCYEGWGTECRPLDYRYPTVGSGSPEISGLSLWKESCANCKNLVGRYERPPRVWGICMNNIASNAGEGSELWQLPRSGSCYFQRGVQRPLLVPHVLRTANNANDCSLTPSLLGRWHWAILRWSAPLFCRYRAL